MPRSHLAAGASISGVALVLALLMSLLVGAPAHAVGGTLSGTLTGHDGERFEYFQVDIYQADGPETWTHAIPPRTITSWDTGLPVGDFAITLPAGTYRACFSPLTFENAEVVGQGCWQGAFEVFGATDIVVTEGGTTTITPSLPRESRLRGRILGPGGVGVSAYVAPYRRMPNGVWTWQGGGTQSMSDGSFVAPDLNPGVYRICLLDVPREFLPECWDDVATLGEAHDLTLPPGSTGRLPFRLARRANIAGTVTRPPASTNGVYVTPHRWSGERWDPITGGAAVGTDGSYRITGLDAGTYRVCAAGYDVVRTCWRQGSQPADATDIVLAPGQSRAGVNLAPGPAGFVTGTLPEVYVGAQGYPSVTAWRQVGNTWQGESTGDAWPTGIGNDWTYEIGSLPTGTYVVCAEHMDPEFVTAFPRTCRGDSPTPQGGIPFEVVAGETTTGIDIVTGRAGEIRGRVSNLTEPVRVDLFTAAGRLADEPDHGRQRRLPLPRAADRHLLRRLPPGDRVVVAGRRVVAQPDRRPRHRRRDSDHGRRQHHHGRLRHAGSRRRHHRTAGGRHRRCRRPLRRPSTRGRRFARDPRGSHRRERRVRDRRPEHGPLRRPGPQTLQRRPDRDVPRRRLADPNQRAGLGGGPGRLSPGA